MYVRTVVWISPKPWQKKKTWTLNSFESSEVVNKPKLAVLRKETIENKTEIWPKFWTGGWRCHLHIHSLLAWIRRLCRFCRRWKYNTYNSTSTTCSPRCCLFFYLFFSEKLIHSPTESFCFSFHFLWIWPIKANWSDILADIFSRAVIIFELSNILFLEWCVLFDSIRTGISAIRTTQTLLPKTSYWQWPHHLFSMPHFSTTMHCCKAAFKTVIW